MLCLSHFCCGYGLRTGGSFIGYYSIATFVKLLVLCVVFLYCIKTRIDENEGVDSFIQQVSFLLRARSNRREIESSIRDLKTYSVIFIAYILLLLVGVLCASFLITGAKLRKPNYLWWWLVYQGVFVIATAGIVILFIRMREEKYGLLSYLKNYLLKTVIVAFVLIYLSFALLSVYFWLSVLSLYTSLRKENRKRSRQLVADKMTRKTSQIVTESRTNLSEDMKMQSIIGSSGSIQLIPLTMFQQGAEGDNSSKEGGKFFIVHV